MLRKALQSLAPQSADAAGLDEDGHHGLCSPALCGIFVSTAPTEPTPSAGDITASRPGIVGVTVPRDVRRWACDTGGTWALRDCSSVRPGRSRRHPWLGPNGAGKTTLLHLAVGLTRPTTGDVPGAWTGMVPRLCSGAGPGELRCAGCAAIQPPVGGRHAAHGQEPEHHAGMSGAGTRPGWRAWGSRRSRKVSALSGGQRAQIALTAGAGEAAATADPGRAAGQPGPAGPARLHGRC